MEELPVFHDFIVAMYIASLARHRNIRLYPKVPGQYL